MPIIVVAPSLVARAAHVRAADGAHMCVRRYLVCCVSCDTRAVLVCIRLQCVWWVQQLDCSQAAMTLSLGVWRGIAAYVIPMIGLRLFAVCVACVRDNSHCCDATSA